MGRSLRSGNTAQAAELLNLKNHLLEQQSHTGADIHTLQQEMALLQTQLRTEQRTQHLLESQGVLIAELRYDQSCDLSGCYVLVFLMHGCLMRDLDGLSLRVHSEQGQFMRPCSDAAARFALHASAW